MPEPSSFPTLSKSELAAKYGRSWATVRAWLRKAGVEIPDTAKTLRPADVARVVSALGSW